MCDIKGLAEWDLERFLNEYCEPGKHEGGHLECSDRCQLLYTLL